MRVPIVLSPVSIPLTLFKFYQMFGNKMKLCDTVTPAWQREFIPAELILYSSRKSLSSNWDELRAQQQAGSRPFRQHGFEVVSPISVHTITQSLEPNE